MHDGAYTLVARVGFSALLVLLVFFVPSWIVVPFGVFGCLLFKKYGEFIGAMILIDLIYASSHSGISGFLYTLIGMLVYIILEVVKKRISWYSTYS